MNGYQILAAVIAVSAVYVTIQNGKPATDVEVKAEETVTTSEAPPTKKVFSESDFYWDKTIEPYKDVIVAGVTRVANENHRCKEIDAGSAYLSSSKGTPQDPVFFCHMQ